MRRLIDVGGALTANLDVESLLNQVLEAARDLTGARYAALGVLDQDREHLERFITTGIEEQAREQIGDLPRGRGVLGLLIRDPKPLRLAHVGEHPDSYGFPTGHPAMSTFLGVPIMIRGEAFGNLYLTEKVGGEFDQADEESVVMLAGWAAIAIENARLYTGVEQRRQELERAVLGLEATTEIALALGGETDIDRVMELIVKRGRALITASSLVILLVEGRDLVVLAAAGDVGLNIKQTSIPIEGTLPGNVLRKGAPELVPDVSAQLRLGFADDISETITSAILVPLMFRDRRLGVIAGFDSRVGGTQFTAEDVRLLRGFAASAATAVVTAQSVQEDRLRLSIEASERERGRWARELHDETLQALAAMRVLHSSALRKGDVEALASASRVSLDQIGTAIENLRGLITELRPAALDEIGLKPALESLIDRAASSVPKIETDIVLPDGDARLPANIESAVYRLVQEALTNVIKHADASHVWIRVEATDAVMEIAVRDDGAGFAPDADANGFGLIGMQERALLAGGELELHTAPGSGTTVQATIPLAAGDGQAGAARQASG